MNFAVLKLHAQLKNILHPGINNKGVILTSKNFQKLFLGMVTMVKRAFFTILGVCRICMVSGDMQSLVPGLSLSPHSYTSMQVFSGYDSNHHSDEMQHGGHHLNYLYLYK